MSKSEAARLLTALLVLIAGAYALGGVVKFADRFEAARTQFAVTASVDY